MRKSFQAVLLFTSLLFASCASTTDLREPEPFVPLPVEYGTEEIGFFLADFQGKLTLWNRLKLEADEDSNQGELRGIERDLWHRSRLRMDDLVEQLEVGPPMNRSTAAVALGFTRDTEVVSPLLAAVSDPMPSVAQNAALGLGLLAWSRTNLSPLRYELINNPDSGVRSNCAYALLEVASAIQREERGERDGSAALSDDPDVLSPAERAERDAELARTCREALADSKESVRVQCAAILGLLRDPLAVEPLEELLYDEWNLPATAAATSLIHIAREHTEHRGPIARLLVDAHERVDKKRARAFMAQLGRLAGRDLGDDFEEWRTWAYDLP